MDNLELLNQLWQEFGSFNKKICDVAHPEHPQSESEMIASLDNIVSDTPEMIKLRERLFAAGVKGIAGFEYE